ncbi:hypothetical protein [Staphylococcus hyicus]|uniref:hypothetical protein n=1 Tax=Staphylococcus hyicus TaxID=1284 RepID=UPI002366DF28|nr:hypothetical protein [Staphylococcus hyicus]
MNDISQINAYTEKYSAISYQSNETHKFINKIKKKHEIEAFTGHSKGGRDPMVLGIEHSITMSNT